MNTKLLAALYIAANAAANLILIAHFEAPPDMQRAREYSRHAHHSPV